MSARISRFITNAPIALLLVIGALALPVNAQSPSAVLLDVGQDRIPPDLLSPAELERLDQLLDQRTFTPQAISPDERWLIGALNTVGSETIEYVLHDIVERRFEPLFPEPSKARLQITWLDNDRIAFLEGTPDGLVLKIYSPRSKLWSIQPLPLPGEAYQVTLSPDGRRVSWIEEAPTAQPLNALRSLTNDALTIIRIPLGPNYRQAADSRVLEIAGVDFRLSVLDLLTGAAQPVWSLPRGSELITPAWSSDGQQLGLLVNRYDAKSTDDRGHDSLIADINHEALGRVPLHENNLWQNNQLVLIDLRDPATGTRTVQATARFPDSAERFSGLRFSPDGAHVLARTEEPVWLSGRPYPTYNNQDVYRNGHRWHILETATLATMASINDPRIALITQAQWLSNDELLFNAPVGFDHQLLHFSLASGVLQPLTGAPEGSYDSLALRRVVHQLVQAGYTQYDRVGITGCSYGGYFAAQSIVRHPGLYAAANPQCSLLDLISEFQNGWPGLIGYLMGATPWEAIGEYVQDSPAFNAARIVTPTLIFHGTRDFLPISIVDNFFDVISRQGTSVRLLRFLEMGHGIANSDLQRYAAQEQIRWFRQYLQQP